MSIQIAPLQATVKAGSQFPFQATVFGTTNMGVHWQVDGVAGGNAASGLIDANGLYTAPTLVPAPATVTITAMPQADATKSATASLTVVVGVTVLPASAALNLNSAQCPSSQQFGATVTGSTNTTVAWSLVANGTTVGGADPSFGTLDSNGLYTAPFTIPAPPKFSVRAISQADTTQSGSAAVAVSAGGPGVDRAAQPFPIALGTSGGNIKDRSGSFCCSGTLGALVTRNGQQFILSNNHVLARSDQAQPGELIDQPGLVDNGCVAPATSVGAFSQAVKLTNAGGTAVADAAIAEVAAGAVDATGSILQMGTLSCGLASSAPPASTTLPPAIGMPVAKSGRTTGLTCGTIDDVAVDNVKVQYANSCGSNSSFTVAFNNQVVIESPGFADAGDSGSLIVNSDTAEPTALLFAGDSTSGLTVANPIQDVLAALPDSNNQALPAIVGGAPHPVAACSSHAPSGSAIARVRPSAIALERARAAKRNHLAALVADPAVLGVGVGANSADAAIVIFVERGKPHMAIPPMLDGVATRTKEIGPIRAFAGCSATSQSRSD